MKRMKFKEFPLIVLVLEMILAGCALDGGDSVTTWLSTDADTVGLWHFNEGSGQAVLDSSTSGWDLTLGEDATVESVDPTWTSGGRFGGGLSFTAVQEDYVKGPGQTGFVASQELTVEFWIKTTSTNVSHPVLTGNVFLMAQLEGTGLLMVMVGDGSNYGPSRSLTTALNDGEWHYVAIVYDGNLNGGTLILYLDGTSEMTETGYGKTLPEPSSWYIGGRPFNTFLNGSMDEMRVSTSARTSVEIAANN